MRDFSAVYGEYREMIYRFIYRLCRNEELAEELTQETFYQAMKSWEKFRGESSVSTWLCAIAKRLYYASLRKQQTLELTENAAHTPDIAETLLSSDRKMAAQRVLHRLPEPYREVFTLRTFCDLSHAQIAQLFEKSESWARVTYHRARQMLQEAMREVEQEWISSAELRKI